MRGRLAAVVMAVLSTLVLSGATAVRAQATTVTGAQPVVCDFQGSLGMIPGVGLAGDIGYWQLGSGGNILNPLCVSGTQVLEVTIQASGSYTNVACGEFEFTGSATVTLGGRSSVLPVTITTAAFTGAWLSIGSGPTLLAGPIALLPSTGVCFLGSIDAFNVTGVLVGIL